MGIAPVQPENPASLAAAQIAQAAVFGDGAPGWMLAAYVPAGAGPADAPAGGWVSVRVQVGGAMPGASLSRVGGGGCSGWNSPAMTARPMRSVRVLVPRALGAVNPATGAQDEGDGLGSKLGTLARGDRLVVPAAKLGLEGVKTAGSMFGVGDLVLTVMETRCDDAFVVAEVSL